MTTDDQQAVGRCTGLGVPTGNPPLFAKCDALCLEDALMSRRRGNGSTLRPEQGVEISPQGPGAGQGAVRYGNAGLGRARRGRARLGQCKAQQGKVFLVT